MSKQQGSKEGNSKELSRLSCTSEIFHCTFCVLFSRRGRAGKPYLCHIRWLYKPACVRGNWHPAHSYCCHVLISGQGSCRPWNWDGKTKGKHGVQGAALSWVMGKLLFCISGLAWHKCFYLVALLSCQSCNVTVHSNTYSKDNQHFWSSYHGWALPSEHFHWSYSHCEQGPSQKRISNIYIAQITGQNCHTDEVNLFTVLGYLIIS